MTTLYALIESPFHPDLGALYQRLGITGIVSLDPTEDGLTALMLKVRFACPSCHEPYDINFEGFGQPR